MGDTNAYAALRSPTWRSDQIQGTEEDQTSIHNRRTESDPGRQNRCELFWLPFALSIYCGGRISEMMHLEWQDIKWQEKRIHIRIKPQYQLKMKTERYVSLPDELRQILQPMAKPHGWIVENKVRSSAKSWRWFFMKLLRAADIRSEGRSPHSTRHTWAALSIATGIDSAQVMEEAGHSNIATTMRYIKCASFYREAVKGWAKGEFVLINNVIDIIKRESF